MFPLPSWLRQCISLVLPLPSGLRHCLYLVFPLPSCLVLYALCYSRGGNLVPFELLEGTADTAYIKRTMQVRHCLSLAFPLLSSQRQRLSKTAPFLAALQSVADGSMNMIRVWCDAQQHRSVPCAQLRP